VPGDANVGTTLGSCPGRPRLAYSGKVDAETLDVWFLDAGDVSETAPEAMVDPSVLDDAERRQANALETPSLRHRYLLAHTALRHVLGEALHLPPRQVPIVRQPCPLCGAAEGRPVLGEPTRRLHFSLSSSGDVVLIGLASSPVGVDVEGVPAPRAVAEASRQLHPLEREELLALVPEQRREVFTRLWSRKEAYLKGIGVGLAHGLVGEYLGTGRQPDPPTGWVLLDVGVPPGYFASAALKTGPAAERPSRRSGRGT
jgi:4'-phosphopantetheinyl transferase